MVTCHPPHADSRNAYFIFGLFWLHTYLSLISLDHRQRAATARGGQGVRLIKKHCKTISNLNVSLCMAACPAPKKTVDSLEKNDSTKANPVLKQNGLFVSENIFGINAFMFFFPEIINIHDKMFDAFGISKHESQPLGFVDIVNCLDVRTSTGIFKIREGSNTGESSTPSSLSSPNV